MLINRLKQIALSLSSTRAKQDAAFAFVESATENHDQDSRFKIKLTLILFLFEKITYVTKTLSPDHDRNNQGKQFTDKSKMLNLTQCYVSVSISTYYYMYTQTYNIVLPFLLQPKSL